MRQEDQHSELYGKTLAQTKQKIKQMGISPAAEYRPSMCKTLGVISSSSWAGDVAKLSASWTYMRSWVGLPGPGEKKVQHKERNSKPSMKVLTCNPSIQDPEARGSEVKGQPVLQASARSAFMHTETLSQT